MSLRFFVESRSGPPKPAPCQLSEDIPAISPISTCSVSIHDAIYTPKILQIVRKPRLRRISVRFYHIQDSLSIHDAIDTPKILQIVKPRLRRISVRFYHIQDMVHAVTMRDPWRSHLVLGCSSDRFYLIREDSFIMGGSFIMVLCYSVIYTVVLYILQYTVLHYCAKVGYCTITYCYDILYFTIL